MLACAEAISDACTYGGDCFASLATTLVRLAISQHLRDLSAGLNTGGLVSGYRGSPLSGYDSELIKAARHLQRHNVHFEPGLNEELGATAVWGSQQIGLFGKPKYDGVFGIWYGKNPGLDRCGDALKHGNFAGSSRYGGVLAVVGDDHAAKSSSIAHQSEQSLAAHSIPVLYPASVGEIIEYGLAGWALSRFSGLWVGLKCVNETLETDATISVSASATSGSAPTTRRHAP